VVDRALLLRDDGRPVLHTHTPLSKCGNDNADSRQNAPFAFGTERYFLQGADRIRRPDLTSSFR
jgi:hypothetical protein